MALPEEVIADELTIQEYIPQRPPMVMVGKLLSVSGKLTRTSFLIDRNNIFCDGQVFREPGLIENIAQTAAAGEGYRSGMEGKSPRPGFIGAVKNLQVYDFPLINNEIITEAVVEHEVLNATIIHGKIFKDQIIIAECEMKIFF